MNKKQKKSLLQIIGAAILLILWKLLPLEENLNSYVIFLLYMIPYFIVGFDILRRAIINISHGQVFDENFLMAVATLGAILLQEYEEGVAVMLFYQIGELFQSYAVGKSRRSISDLMDIRPDYANLETEDGIEVVDPDEVEIGSILVIKPGEKIPIDGHIIEGKSTLDTAALTGESIPRDVSVGDSVLSGCINQSGLLRIMTDAEFDESTASKILDMVENASSKKSRSENFISKFAKYYTPAVCYSALALAILPPIVNLLLGNGFTFATWIYRALTFLVISCPCALVISIPLTFFAGLGGASSSGVLIKGSNYLETLSQVTTIAFDKTGTITKGNFEVTGLHHNTMDEKTVLYYSAHLEAYSSHPIALSLRQAYGERIDESIVTDIEEISGEGLIGNVNGTKVACGNAKLMKRLGLNAIGCHEIGTLVHVAINNEYQGHILIADQVKPTSKEAISSLYSIGIKKTIMLTGDGEAVAKHIAEDLSISQVHAELLPQDKVSRVEDLLAECGPKDKLAFVGDGINDAPVLSRADIGIAMGALGSDAAIEAADIVLMDDDPLKIAKAIRISKKCMRIVYENIYFAIGIKLICLLLGALGIANMWVAIFADVGVMVLAVLNAIRCLSVRKL